MNRARNILLIAMVLPLAAFACQTGLPFGNQTVPVSSPVLPASASAQTGAGKPAAAPAATVTPTSLVLTATVTATMTAFPSITPLPPPSATATETPFGYVPPGTPTDVLTPGTSAPDPAEGATDDWGSQTRCTLTGKTPQDWEIQNPGGIYKASWTLYNSGVRTWNANEMKLTFLDGARILPQDGKQIQLPKDVKVDNTITAVITYLAPKTPGTYRSVYGLRMNKTGHIFCTFTLKITIQ